MALIYAPGTYESGRLSLTLKYRTHTTYTRKVHAATAILIMRLRATLDFATFSAPPRLLRPAAKRRYTSAHMRVVGTGAGLYYGRRRAVRALSVAPFLDDDLEEEDSVDHREEVAPP